MGNRGLWGLWVVLTVLPLVGCGPIYETRYTLTPPPGAEGRACVFQCDNTQLRCRQIQDLERQNCERDEQLAHYEYQNCLNQREKDSGIKCAQRYVYCPSASYESCEAEYRSCFQTCGGVVQSRQECVFNCQ